MNCLPQARVNRSHDEMSRWKLGKLGASESETQRVLIQYWFFHPKLKEKSVMSWEWWTLNLLMFLFIVNLFIPLSKSGAIWSNFLRKEGIFHWTLSRFPARAASVARYNLAGSIINFKFLWDFTSKEHMIRENLDRYRYVAISFSSFLGVDVM